MLTNMRRSPCTSKFLLVLLSFLLGVAFGSSSHLAHSLQDPVNGIPPAGGEKEGDESGGGLLSHWRSVGAASPKAERVQTGDPVLWLSKALHFRPYVEVNFPHRTPLPRHFSGYFHKEDNKGDHGDHPMPTEPGAQVHCWNEAHVFDVVLPASEVAKHFPHECQQPLSCNTTCVAKVPCRNLCARLQSGCTEPTRHAVPETELGTAQNENIQLASLEKKVDRRLGELDTKLAQLLLESSYHKDKLVELAHNLSHLGDALKEELAAASLKTLHSLDNNAAQMKALLNSKSESMMTAISSVVSLVQGDSKMHLWTLKGYAAEKAEAIRDGLSGKWSEKVYIKRYLISWGIIFEKSTGGVNLHLTIQLHKGISDEYLEWPFPNELKLSIIHPNSGEKQEGRGKPNLSGSFLQYYKRPVWDHNPWVNFKKIKFESSYLERNGYVNNDQLLLKLELL